MARQLCRRARNLRACARGDSGSRKVRRKVCEEQGRFVGTYSRGRAQRAAHLPRWRHHWREVRGVDDSQHPPLSRRRQGTDDSNRSRDDEAHRDQGPQPLHWRIRPRQDDGRDICCSLARHGACDWRLRQGLSLHLQSRHGDWRRHSARVARRREDREHGVHPVPSDLPLPSAGEALPYLRGRAWRRCCSCEQARPRVHEEVRPSRVARAARHRCAFD